jgi:hypothetical protein
MASGVSDVMTRSPTTGTGLRVPSRGGEFD